MLSGQSPEVSKIKKLVREIAKTNDNALITGEVGTGKKHIALEIHGRSRQKNKPFVEVNCSAIGETIFEEDLYGAKIDGPLGIERKIGLLEQAKRGTLYMENIDELKQEFQQQFFNILRERKFRKSGEKEIVDVTFRVIASTTDNQIVNKDTIRRDLLSLLSMFTVHVPPLRDRQQDIPILFAEYLQKFCEEFNRELPDVPRDLFHSLMEYEWKGNIGELKTAVRNLVIMSPEGEVSIEYLPFEIRKHPFEFLEGRDLPDAISEVERYLIKKSLRKYAGNQTKAARHLNVSEAALRYKMKKYGYSRKTF